MYSVINVCSVHICRNKIWAHLEEVKASRATSELMSKFVELLNYVL